VIAGTRYERTSWRLGLLLTLLVPVSVAGRDPDELTAPATPGEIKQLIADLGDSSYDQRRFTTRRLWAIGPPARRQLLEAKNSASPEIALRAGHLLSVFEQFMFFGVTVELEFSRQAIGWDEPVDLTVTLTNTSKFTARIPMELKDALRTRAGTDARQVADMLDVCEWLHVMGPKDRAVGLRVDDINLDEDVTKAVQARLSDPPVDTLEPNEQAKLVVRSFNRGWARVPLLDAGRYRVRFDYRPEWNDPVLFDAGVGRVQSQVVELTVTKGAPATVSRRGVEASVKLHQQGGAFVARLINRTDQRMLVNHNFGMTPPFAVGRWVYDGDGVMHELNAARGRGNSWHDFKAEALKPVEPGESVELARITERELLRRVRAKGVELGAGRAEVYYTYSNLCDRSWQRRQGDTLLGNDAAPAVFRTLLPRRVLAGWHTSNRIDIDAPLHPGD